MEHYYQSQRDLKQLGSLEPSGDQFFSQTEPVMLVLLRCLHHPGLMSMLAALRQRSDDPWFPTLKFVIQHNSTQPELHHAAAVPGSRRPVVANASVRELICRLWTDPDICETALATRDTNGVASVPAALRAWACRRPDLQARLCGAPHGLFVIRGSVLLWEFIPSHSLDTPDLSAVPQTHPCLRMASQREAEFLQ